MNTIQFDPALCKRSIRMTLGLSPGSFGLIHEAANHQITSPKGNKRQQKVIRLWARKTLEEMSRWKARHQEAEIKALPPINPKGSKFAF